MAVGLCVKPASMDTEQKLLGEKRREPSRRATHLGLQALSSGGGFSVHSDPTAVEPQDLHKWKSYCCQRGTPLKRACIPAKSELFLSFLFSAASKQLINSQSPKVCPCVERGN